MIKNERKKFKKKKNITMKLKKQIKKKIKSK